MEIGTLIQFTERKVIGGTPIQGEFEWENDEWISIKLTKAFNSGRFGTMVPGDMFNGRKSIIGPVTIVVAETEGQNE